MNAEIVIKKKTCKRCEHEWIPRQEREPVFCPKCRSPYWNMERIRIQEAVNDKS